MNTTFTFARRPALARLLTLAMALAVAAIVAHTATARAATFTVTNLNDSGAGSLRAVIGGASSGDTIVFQAGISGTITLTSGELQPTGSVTIDANANANSITISGGNTQRILTVTASVTITVNSVTFTGGSNGGSGGAISNGGTLTLNGCTLSGNTAGFGGGAIDSLSGSTLSLTNCTLSGNTALFGGGINTSSATVTLIHCTIAGNTGTNGTGGIVVANGTTTLTNTIIAGNANNGFSTDKDVGGSGSSIAMNGVNFIGMNATTYNTGAFAAGSPNASGQYVGTSASPISANLAALASNGGPVQTMLPNSGSIVIDKVITGGVVVATDARDNARSIDGDVSGTAQPDIGAVEFVPAAFLTVSNTNDPGTGSLRQAIANAAQLAGAQSLNLSAVAGQTITLANTITINNPAGVTMDASAGSPVTISGAGAGGIFRLFQNAFGSTAAFKGLALTNGGGTHFGGNGGAISNSGTLTLTQCTLSGNISSFGNGGAISNSGPLTLTQCTLSGNSASSGGAISNSGPLTLTQCTLSGNSAAGGNGGAISNNGALTLTQCTLSGNSANSGGAIYVGVATLTLTNSIVAANTAPTGPDIQNSGALTPSGVNFIGDVSGSGQTASSTILTTATKGAVRLGPLANNGGTTQTMLPLRGSPVINAVPDAAIVAGLTNDQRGVFYTRSFGTHVDLGAVEFQTNFNARDLDGDGITDVVLQNGAGQVFVWYLNASGGIASGAYLYGGGLPWSVVGIADMNGDKHPDVILQNAAGQVFVWYLDKNGVITSGAYIYAGALPFRVVGVADMELDGNPDIVLQNSAGQVYKWKMTGSAISSGQYIYGGGLSFRVAALADMNNDNIPDVVLQNGAGQVFVWYMNLNGTIGSGAYLYAGGLPWSVVGAADMNGDGNADILLQNGAGQVFVWYMNGAGGITSGAYIYGGGLSFGVR